MKRTEKNTQRAKTTKNRFIAHHVHTLLCILRHLIGDWCGCGRGDGRIGGTLIAIDVVFFLSNTYRN